MAQPTALPILPAAPLTAEAGGRQQYLAFNLNGEVFAIDILQIREIIEFGKITIVPMAPPSVRGVINLRGAVVPVIDLSAHFRREPTPVARRTCIVILEVPVDGQASQSLGIIVDAVNEVLEIPACDIEPAPSFGTRLRTDFIAGMGRVAGRFIIILDLPKVISLDELGQLAELTQVDYAVPVLEAELQAA